MVEKLMDNEKQFWKSIYYWIRYFDYHLINIEKMKMRYGLLINIKEK